MIEPAFMVTNVPEQPEKWLVEYQGHVRGIALATTVPLTSCNCLLSAHCVSLGSNTRG